MQDRIRVHVEIRGAKCRVLVKAEEVQGFEDHLVVAAPSRAPEFRIVDRFAEQIKGKVQGQPPNEFLCGGLNRGARG